MTAISTTTEESPRRALKHLGDRLEGMLYVVTRQTGLFLFPYLSIHRKAQSADESLHGHRETRFLAA